MKSLAMMERLAEQHGYSVVGVESTDRQVEVDFHDGLFRYWAGELGADMDEQVTREQAETELKVKP